MVGDNLKTDIKFGNSCHIDTLVVLSGNTDFDAALKAQVASGSQKTEDGAPTFITPYFSYSKHLKL
jgi:ribonucleotide monophosphatase NagD (HAD superfamily)